MSTEKNATDRYRAESSEGVDAVLDRMLGVLGVSDGFSYATALDVPPNTIKTWRRRGEVPMRFLAAFAKENDVTIEYLQSGATVAKHIHAYSAPAAEEPPAPAYLRPTMEWRQVLVLVVDGLREKGRFPTGEQLVKIVDGVMTVLQIEEESDRETIRGKISALL